MRQDSTLGRPTKLASTKPFVSFAFLPIQNRYFKCEALRFGVLVHPLKTFLYQVAPAIQFTVNIPLLVALPPDVVMPIFPVLAPVGTVAVNWVPEFTVKAACTPPNVTLVAPVNPDPVIVT